MKKNENKFNRKDIILLLIMLILIIVNLIIFVKEISKPTLEQESNIIYESNVKSNKKSNDKSSSPQTDEEKIKYLSTLPERNRMEYYCGQYFNHLEKREYESAYKLLYEEFKQKYFPTLEEYTAYIQKTYPKLWSLEYNDITRQGTIYVLKLDILDVLGEKSKSKISQRIVVKENNYNDYVISFQVI